MCTSEYPFTSNNLDTGFLLHYGICKGPNLMRELGRLQVPLLLYACNFEDLAFNRPPQAHAATRAHFQVCTLASFTMVQQPSDSLIL